jgi:hypothetical protein
MPKKTRKYTKTPPAILEYLAKQEASKWELKKELGKSYAAIHSAVSNLKKIDEDFKQPLIVVSKKIDSVRNPNMKVEYYRLTILGVVMVFYNWDGKIVNVKDVTKTVQNYSDIGWLAFKKFNLFEERGLGYEMLKYIVNGFSSAFALWRMFSDYITTGRTQLDLIKDIDREIIVGSLINEKDKELAKKIAEVYKSDSDLKAFVDADFACRMKEFDSYIDAKTLWENL